MLPELITQGQGAPQDILNIITGEAPYPGDMSMMNGTGQTSLSPFDEMLAMTGDPSVATEMARLSSAEKNEKAFIDQIIKENRLPDSAMSNVLGIDPKMAKMERNTMETGTPNIAALIQAVEEEMEFGNERGLSLEETVGNLAADFGVTPEQEKLVIEKIIQDQKSNPLSEVLGGQEVSGTPFMSFAPDSELQPPPELEQQAQGMPGPLPVRALQEGGIVNKPTITVLGEGGAEIVLSMDSPLVKSIIRELTNINERPPTERELVDAINYGQLGSNFLEGREYVMDPLVTPGEIRGYENVPLSELPLSEQYNTMIGIDHVPFKSDYNPFAKIPGDTPPPMSKGEFIQAASQMPPSQLFGQQVNTGIGMAGPLSGLGGIGAERDEFARKSTLFPDPTPTTPTSPTQDGEEAGDSGLTRGEKLLQIEPLASVLAHKEEWKETNRGLVDIQDRMKEGLTSYAQGAFHHDLAKTPVNRQKMLWDHYIGRIKDVLRDAPKPMEGQVYQNYEDVHPRTGEKRYRTVWVPGGHDIEEIDDKEQQIENEAMAIMAYWIEHDFPEGTIRDFWTSVYGNQLGSEEYLTTQTKGNIDKFKELFNRGVKTGNTYNPIGSFVTKPKNIIQTIQVGNYSIHLLDDIEDTTDIYVSNEHDQYKKFKIGADINIAEDQTNPYISFYGINIPILEGLTSISKDEEITGTGTTDTGTTDIGTTDTGLGGLEQGPATLPGILGTFMGDPAGLWSTVRQHQLFERGLAENPRWRRTITQGYIPTLGEYLLKGERQDWGEFLKGPYGAMEQDDKEQAWQNLVYTSRGLGSEEDKFSHELAGKYEAALTGDGDAQKAKNQTLAMIAARQNINPNSYIGFQEYNRIGELYDIHEAEQAYKGKPTGTFIDAYNNMYNMFTSPTGSEDIIATGSASVQ
jgi:hypothetical protein